MKKIKRCHDLYKSLKAERERVFHARGEKDTQYNRDRIAAEICFFALHEASQVLEQTLDEDIPPALYLAIQRTLHSLGHVERDIWFWNRVRIF